MTRRNDGLGRRTGWRRDRVRAWRTGREGESLEPRHLMAGFTAYNGLYASEFTHPQTTYYSPLPGSDAAGLLQDVVTGAPTAVLLSTSQTGVNFGGTGAQPAPGTDAADVFSGYVDFAAGATRSIELDGQDTYSYTFENLDAGATYQFAGSAIRGNSAYTDRWTLVELVGADSFRAAHSTLPGIYTVGLGPNQVAIWTGDNSQANQGAIVQWKDIVAGADREFSVIARQYTGTIPTQVHPGGTATGNKGYGLAGVRLTEDAPLGPPTVETLEATQIEAFAAELSGRVTATGGQIPQTRIYFGTSDGGTDPASWARVLDLGTNARDFTTRVGELTQNTTYFYRAFAQNGQGASWAPTTRSFRTLVASPPQIENAGVVQVGPFTATLQGRVTNTGNDTPLVTVYYGAEDGGTQAGAWEHAIDVGEQTGLFSAVATDLLPLSNYFYRVRAQNALGTSWSPASTLWTTTDIPPVGISEVLTDNNGSLVTRVRSRPTDAFVGDRLSPDFIELRNPTSAPLDLGGFSLTDNVNNLRQWPIPAGTIVPPQGYRVFFASGLDVRDSRLDENGYLHTNFQLNNAGGEPVLLVDGAGRVMSQLGSLPVQSQNVSYGVDGAGIERYYPVPTPGRDNADDTPRVPTFSVPSGTFTANFSVELVPATPNDTIYYTLDERVPTTGSTRYTGPIAVGNSLQIRAISVGTNGKTSNPVSATYVKLNTNVITATSNLPIMVVDTLGDPIGSSFTDVFVGWIEPGVDGRSAITEPFVDATRAGMHVRGSSSSGFAKKQYRVEFWDDANEDRRLSVLGMPDEADWIFYGPGEYDRNLISNPLMYDLSNQIDRYAVRTRYVEMYLNANGGDVASTDYVGVYAIMEVIEAGEDRVDVGRLSTGAGGVPVSGGFVWKNDRGSPYVDPETLTAAQQTYIDRWISNLRTAAAAPNFADPVNGYAKYADVDSFVDHNLLNMLSMNVDALRLSSYYFKRPDGLLEAGPIWDFDRALDSTDGRDNNARSWFGSGDSTRYFDDSDRVMSWWPDMFQDANFVQRYIDRWFELRATTFSLTNLNATIDRHAAQLQEAAPRDYRRWSGSRYTNFAGEISHLKAWLKDRVEWIDSQWLSRPTFSVTTPAVAPGTSVTLSAPLGQVYYTLDGSDPRGSGGSIQPQARLASGPIPIQGATKITARVFRDNHGPTTQGYVAKGDDWSAPVQAVYFTESPASAANLAITELHYHPADPTPVEISAGFMEASDFEFIELMNVGSQPIQLIGARLQTRLDGDQTEGVAFDFTQGSKTLLAPQERVVVVENLAAFRARYGQTPTVVGTWSGRLSNGGERVVLVDYAGQTIRDFRFSDGGLWPTRADGRGSSLEVVRFDGDLTDPENWRASVAYHGTPGAAPVLGSSIVINEIVSRSEGGAVDAIELYNAGDIAVDASGWYLSDRSDALGKYRLANGTVIPPRTYWVLDERSFNPIPPDDSNTPFSFDSVEGESAWLTEFDILGRPSRFIDSVSFPASAAGESFGRVPNGVGPLVPLMTPTLNGVNDNPRVGPVVLSEIHYAPGSPSLEAIVREPSLTRDQLEFVEIANTSGLVVDLTNWRMRGAVDYDFAADLLAPGETRVILSFDPHDPVHANRTAAFRLQYGIGADVPLLGPYRGQLSDQREQVVLQRPDLPPLDDPTYIPRLLEDGVLYRSSAPWPTTPAGQGPSLTRQAPVGVGHAANSWAAATPSPGTTQLPGGALAGDFDGNRIVDEADIEALAVAVRAGNHPAPFDLTGDGRVDTADWTRMINSILRTTFGDANLDRVFNSTDLIQVFVTAEYEDAIDGNSTWADGDWDGDGEFTSGDLVVAFQAAGYVANARPMGATNAAPQVPRAVARTAASAQMWDWQAVAAAIGSWDNGGDPLDGDDDDRADA